MATRLCENGHRVSAVARCDDRLAAMATKLPGFWSAGCDVTMANQLAESVAVAENAQGSIDAAILNAGIYQPQDGSAIDPAIYANHMDVNYMGVVNALAGNCASHDNAWRGTWLLLSRQSPGGAACQNRLPGGPDQGSADLTCRVAPFRPAALAE